MEKHELKVEKYVEHEAGLMVRRTFGGSRRLSQMEKDDIHHLVALRTQYAKEVWQVSLHFLLNIGVLRIELIYITLIKLIILVIII